MASDHVHRFLQYKPHQDSSKSVQWFKGISFRVRWQEFPHLRKPLGGRHLWAWGYLAVSSGNSPDELIQKSIEEQEGEPRIDDRRFPIDS